MSTMHGKSGTVSYGAGTNINSAQAGEVTTWTITATGDVVEDTSMGDTWKTYLPGFLDWTGSCSFNLDSAGLPLASLFGISAALDFDTVDGKEFNGSAICTSCNITNEKDGTSTVDIDFQGTGALSEVA